MPAHPKAVQPVDMECVACKAPVLSLGRPTNFDPRLGVEMQSTSEVACFGVSKYEASLKAVSAAGFKLPAKNVLVSTGAHQQKLGLVEVPELLVTMGHQLYVARGTHELLKNNGIESRIVEFKARSRRECPESSSALWELL